MDTRYYCPHCGAHLNPKDDVVLRAASGGGRGLLLLHPQPGNYVVAFGQGLSIERGAVVELACPVCDASFTSSRDESMAELVFEAAARRGVVVFSRVYGKHATYIITGNDVASFGEDSEKEVLNFWGAGPGP